MSTAILQRLSTWTFSNKHLNRLLRVSDHIPFSVPSPSPTVTVSQVPALFREPYILTGYRPTRQDWSCYLFTLFQKHNECLNVWTHLLAAPILLFHWWAKADALGFTLDAASLPLYLFLASSLSYMFFSVAAHLLHSHCEHSHYVLFFLDYVGVAVYQYGSSLGHYFYSSEVAWREGLVGMLFLPGAALFGWLSCLGCCVAKFRYKRPYPWQRKICQLVPTSAAYLLDISPVVHRLVTVPWTQEPSLPFHALQIASFLLSAVFFSYPIPECFFPGCDFCGSGVHQIFPCALNPCGLEALFPETTARRRDYGGGRYSEKGSCGGLAWASQALFACCMLTALLTMRHVKKHLQTEQKKDK
uniref:Progestin and adipoQ receptor family member VIII n=1 Tax=Tetraodon nigroviridis TaxID=99883 RepID=H3BZ96_TETNG